jgi:hypothetical protein
MSDPFDYRCPRCGTPMLEEGECGRPDCCSPLDFVRAVASCTCSAVLRALRWLGLVE